MNKPRTVLAIVALLFLCVFGFLFWVINIREPTDFQELNRSMGFEDFAKFWSEYEDVAQCLIENKNPLDCRKLHPELGYLFLSMDSNPEYCGYVFLPMPKDWWKFPTYVKVSKWGLGKTEKKYIYFPNKNGESEAPFRDLKSHELLSRPNGAMLTVINSNWAICEETGSKGRK